MEGGWRRPTMARMGTYTCAGDTSCTVTVNGKGELTAASDGWIFTPADGATVRRRGHGLPAATASG